MSQIAVRCEHLSKSYDKNPALDDFNLCIPANRIAGILGPNGCGKSTFFRAVTGLARPDGGSIEVLGQTPGWQTNQEISYLPDRARWYPNHTPRDAFAWAGAFLPGFDRGYAGQLADFMEIDMDAKAGGMSRGQEARLMLTLCLARNVPLIVLDEPFSGIDVISREQIIEGIIRNLENREQTVLISTHEIHEVEGLFDYTVLIDRGQVIWSGETDDLRAEHGSMHQVFRTLYKGGRRG